MHRKGNNGSEPGEAKPMAKRITDCPPGKEFVFSTPDGKTAGKAKNIIEFIGQVKSAPIESILYHANGNHFAPWLEMIGEKDVSARVSKVRGSGQEVRLLLIRCV